MKEKLKALRHDVNNMVMGSNELLFQIKEMRARIDKLEEPIHVEMPKEVTERLKTLTDSVKALMHRANCSHKPFSIDGRTPFFIVSIADARKVTVPGQMVEPSFALGLCKKCWQVYVAIDKMDEAPPMRSIPPGEMSCDLQLVKKGEVIE